MAAFINDPDRNVIPRWLSFDEASKASELDSADSRTPVRVAADLESLIKDWRISNSKSTACDLIGLAYASGDGIKVKEVAEKVLEHGAPNPTVERICRNCLVDVPRSEERFRNAFALPEITNLINQVRRYKERLEIFPWNPVVWSNLALLYTTLGQHRKAQRAIRIACSLSPDNRLVLRASARFHLHCGDPERARSVLQASSRLQSDPWLIASEIAISQVMGQTSKLVRKGLQFVESERFSPFHVSELHSAISALEFFNGNSRKAKRHCIASLEVPCENAIAQAAWMQRRSNREFVGLSNRTLYESYEAEAWHLQKLGEWRKAVDATICWQLQEPFSSRPAVQGGYLAMTALDDYELAIRIMSFAETSNPDDSLLLNNLAFANACIGNLASAENYLERASAVCTQDRQKIVLMATRGLIEHRNGHHQQGKLFYQTAISIAESRGDHEVAKTAKVFSLLEESRVQVGGDRNQSLREADVICQGLVDESARKILAERVSRAETYLNLSLIQSRPAIRNNEVNLPDNRPNS